MLRLKFKVLGWIADAGSVSPSQSSAAQARAALARTTHGPHWVMGRPAAMVRVVDEVVAGVPVRRYTPPDVQPGTLVYFHGGGWVVGDLDTYDGVARGLAATARRSVVSVHYRRAPESVWPAAHDDCTAVTRALLAEGPVIVVGDSAGGNLAAAVALRLPGQLAGQVLIYPVVDCSQEHQSYQDFASGPVLTAAAMRHYIATYAPDPASRQSPDLSPLHAPLPPGLAPAYVLLAGCDVLRDEGRAYAEHLAHASVPTTCDEVSGVFHGFVNLQGLAETRAAMARLGRWLRGRFGAV